MALDFDARDLASAARQDAANALAAASRLTVSALAGLRLSPIITSIDTSGYAAPGDAPIAHWVRRATDPGHPAARQLADGTWLEMDGYDFHIANFGGKADCPDTRDASLGLTTQAQITAAITAATNNAAAFRAAAITAKIKGKGRILYGPSVVEQLIGKRAIFRVAFSPAIPGVALPNRTKMVPLHGAVVQRDPTLWTSNYGVAAPAGTPAGWVSLENEFGVGDPVLCVRPGPSTGLSADYRCDAAGVSEGMFFEGISFDDVIMWQDIRTPAWRGSNIATTRYRSYGIRCWFPVNGSFRNVQIEGMSNDGLMVIGGWNNLVENPVLIANGYGAQKSTSQNGLTVRGVVVTGRPDLSTRDNKIIGARTYRCKDAGIAYGVQENLLISDHVDYASHTQAIEGVSSSTASSADVGEKIRNSVRIEGVKHLGRHDVGTGAITAGQTSLVMPDAWWVTTHDESGARSIFVAGAGAAGADLVSTITAVDYTTNTVTLATAAGTTVAGAKCWVKSLTSITPSAGNEGVVRVRDVEIDDVYALWSIIAAAFDDGGDVDISGVKLTNSTISGVADNNQNAIQVQAAKVRVSNVETLNCVGRNNSSIISCNGANTFDTFVDDVRSDGGFQSAVRAGSTATAQKRLSITRLNIDACGGGPIHVYTGSAVNDMLTITDNQCRNFGTAASEGFVYFRTLTGKWAEIIVRRNTTRVGAGLTNLPLGAQSAIPANSFARMSVNDNDWGLDGWYYFVGSTQVYSSFDNSGGAATQMVDENNGAFGNRSITVNNAAPTTGAWGLGDRARNRAPAAGGTAEWRCTTPGVAGVAINTTISAAGGSSRSFTVTDATGIIPGTMIIVAGSGGGLAYRVVKVVGNTVTIGTFFSSTALGAAVTSQAPVFKAVALAA